MLSNFPQPKLFLRHQLVVVSRDREFQQQIRELTQGDAEFGHYRYLSRFPEVSALDENVFYAAIIDINERPKQSLQWIAKARQNGFTMPVIAVGPMTRDPDALAVRPLRVGHRLGDVRRTVPAQRVVQVPDEVVPIVVREAHERAAHHNELHLVHRVAQALQLLDPASRLITRR